MNKYREAFNNLVAYDNEVIRKEKEQKEYLTVLGDLVANAELLIELESFVSTETETKQFELGAMVNGTFVSEHDLKQVMNIIELRRRLK